jgi:hypothetical protein
MFREIATLIGYLAYAVYILGFFGLVTAMILLSHGYVL